MFNTKRNKNANFIFELYPGGQTLIYFLQNACGINNIAERVQSFVANGSYDGIQLYNETMDVFNKSIIDIPKTSVNKMPATSSATNMKNIIEQFLRIKFSKNNYNRKDSVLTLSYFRTNYEYNGKNKFVPLLNVDSITMCDGSDEINFLLTNKSCHILHQLIGDDTLFFLLNKAAIFVAVPFKHRQYWQLAGTPCSEIMWKQHRNKCHTKPNINTNNKHKRKRKRKTKICTLQIKGYKMFRDCKAKQYTKCTTKTDGIECKTKEKEQDTGKLPRKSLLGKRKWNSLNLVNTDNACDKYRRLNRESTSISVERDRQEIKIKKHTKCNRQILKHKSSGLWTKSLKGIEITRYNIFYCGRNCGQFDILSGKNLLNILPASNIGSELLIRYIFFGQTLESFKEFKQLQNERIECKKKDDIPTRRTIRLFGGKLSKIYKKLIPFFKKLLINYKKLNWYQFREIIEGSSQDKNNLNSSLSKDDFKSKLTALISYDRGYKSVMQFVSVFLNRIFVRIAKYWGLGKENKIKFKKFIFKIISSQRYAKFTMLEAMGKMSTKYIFENVFKNLRNFQNNSIHNSEIKLYILMRFCLYLIKDIVIDMLRWNYYITERSYIQSAKTTYYGCKIWQKITSMYLKKNNKMFQGPISKNKLYLKYFKKQKDTELGIGFLRFVPKGNGSLRPIINQSRNSTIFDNIYIAPNKKLNQLFYILRHQVNKYKINNKKQDILGCSVFCVREYYHNWLLFVKKYKKMKTKTKIYCVSADLSKCYDRINQDVLMQIVRNKLLYKENYRLLKYNAIFPQVGKIFQRYKYGVDYGQIQDIARDGAMNGINGAFIISNQGYRKLINNEDILQLLLNHIKHTIVYLNGQYYKHNVGISQGSVISQLLNCVYIGQCEKLIIKKILASNRSNHNTVRLMMRHVDDFIFFTTNKKEAILFADILHSGIDEFNILANSDKTCTNFVYGNKCNNTPWISWCGFLWNTETLNVRVHYRDHTLNLKENLLTYSIKSSNGKFIINKLIKLIRHKIEPLLLDENINSKSNLIYNLYQTFYVCGARFVTCAINLPFKNEYFLWNCLMEIIKCTWIRIQISKKKASLKTVDMKFSLRFYEIQYIAGRAYKHSIMTKYHSLFSRIFQKKLNKFIYIKSKCIKFRNKDEFHKYTDCNQLMHDKLHDFIY